MFVDATIDPSPPIDRRVTRVRHVSAGVEAPACASLGAYLVAIAKERPNGLRSAVVTWMVLLRCGYISSQFHPNYVQLDNPKSELRNTYDVA